MKYTGVDFTIVPNESNGEILIALLSEIGYSMFEETDTGVRAFIETRNFKSDQLTYLKIHNDEEPVQISWTIHHYPEENWNSEWERNFNPVKVDNRVYIRAEYHPFENAFEHELIIHPRMAFGTGHHATTVLMIEAMLELEFEGKSVLDMGCGTGILAILASRLGANYVTAVDIDPNSTENTGVNADANHVKLDRIVTGTANFEGTEKFDIILANINRNIILEDLPLYLNRLHTGGTLVTSGYLVGDKEIIEQRAKECSLTHHHHRESEGWRCDTWEFEV
jgi:ribosomal protein L11 methyltransferase